MYLSQLLGIYLPALCCVLCPPLAAQRYQECPQTIMANERDRQRIIETGRKFSLVLERYQNKPADIVFLLDSSAIVGEGYFGCEVQFVRHFSKLFSVSPETSRVAVVTCSSCDKIYTDLDYINSPIGKNKCTLLDTDLRRTHYRDGETCIVGGLLRAKEILAGSRPSTQKIIFLLTAGQSTDGEILLELAAEMQNTSTIFAIGLGESVSIDELNGIATSPSEDHVILLNLVTDVESLAVKVLGDQTDTSWDLNVTSDICNSLCLSESNCCDSHANCSCATQTGSYGCACHPGYTGDGEQDQCTACPHGTFKSQHGNQGCTSCPTLSTTAAEGSTSLSDCQCLSGHQGSPDMKVPCTPAAKPTDSGEDGSLLCGEPPSIENGSYETYNRGTSIAYLCDDGFMMYTFGGRKRHCRDGIWTGNTPICSSRGCVIPRTDSVQNGLINIKQSGAILQIDCQAGYELRGSSVLYCNGRRWNGTLPTCTSMQSSSSYPALVRDGTHCGNNIPTVSNADLRYSPRADAEGRLFYALVYSCHPGHTLRPANYAVYCSGGNVVGTLPACLATCGYNNGGCQHICRNGPDGAVCSCRDGYQPASTDGKTCRDVNECLANNGRGPCQHICYNRPGSFSCYCHSGFNLAQDKTSCLRNQDQCNCGPHGRCVRLYDTRPTCVCYNEYRRSIDGLRCIIKYKIALFAWSK